MNVQVNLAFSASLFPFSCKYIIQEFISFCPALGAAAAGEICRFHYLRRSLVLSAKEEGRGINLRSGKRASLARRGPRRGTRRERARAQANKGAARVPAARRSARRPSNMRARCASVAYKSGEDLEMQEQTDADDATRRKSGDA